ncbi:enoyl-CoA hydratase [Vibrio sinaloensis DSM 21326]|uniref:Enoyl-CoA hydratase n=1 Tax=Vibrio sinaloensis DSM 21326 TaxID=945550 RepID=E8M599_PHOS4|nr:enoyl-CoA hydratase [Vibrio sinaloensis DSM 21326]
MTQETGVKCSIDGHVAIITMDNPPANTWTEQSLASLKERVEELNANTSIYALVITGAGDKFFFGRCGS